MKKRASLFAWTPVVKFVFTLSVMFYIILILVAWLFTGLIGYKRLGLVDDCWGSIPVRLSR